MITGIYIGNDRLDLFEDENISIESTVVKIKDITKIFTDTSNSFTVPASDLNNKILKHWYDVDVLNGFTSREKIPAVIEFSGINYKVGKIVINDVKLESNKPVYYKIEFFGNLVDLKDRVQDDKLTNLDLSSLNFVYSSANVKSRFQNTNDVAFSMISKRRLLYDSSESVIDNDKQTNIYYNGTDSNTGVLPSDLTGSVKQLKIIEAIENKYNITFSRDFLGKYDFSNQYLALTGSDVFYQSAIPLTTDVVADPTRNGNALMVLGDLVTENEDTLGIELGITPNTGYTSVKYNLIIKNGGEEIARRNGLSGVDFISVGTSFYYENVTFHIETEDIISYDAVVYRFKRGDITTETISNNTFSNPVYNVSNRMPDIKVIDYLKGIFMMSKLVAIPQKDSSIYIDSLDNYYKNGKVYDLTKYIDFKSFNVSSSKVLNEIKYKFQEPKTILNKQFKELNNIGYGDLELSIYDENGSLIEGDKETYTLPFEQLVYEKIVDIDDNVFDSKMQYGLIQNESLDFVTIKPHVHYIETFSTDSGGLKFINDSKVAEELLSFNCPIHVLSNSLQLYSTTFGSELNEYNNQIITNTLYTNYHQTYIEGIFNNKKRSYSYKAVNVPPQILLKLNLNDVIEIKDSYYRIDSFKVNTINNDIDFNLVNDRIVDLTPIYPVSSDSTVITADRTDITADSTSSKKIEPINIM